MSTRVKVSIAAVIVVALVALIFLDMRTSRSTGIEAIRDE